MKLGKISKKYEELKIRDMSELEIQGSILYLYELTTETEELEFGEKYSSINEVKNLVYYCGKNLHIQDGFYVKGFYINSLFMIENSYDIVFCVCSNNQKFDNNFVCRIYLTE